MAMKANELPLLFVLLVVASNVQVESVWGQYFDIIIICKLFGFNYISMITCEIKFWHLRGLFYSQLLDIIP